MPEKKVAPRARQMNFFFGVLRLRVEIFGNAPLLAAFNCHGGALMYRKCPSQNSFNLRLVNGSAISSCLVQFGGAFPGAKTKQRSHTQKYTSKCGFSCCSSYLKDFRRFSTSALRKATSSSSRSILESLSFRALLKSYTFSSRVSHRAWRETVNVKHP